MILVTGASGFVGRHVTRSLAESGVRVRAMVRTARGAAALDGVRCELVRGDVTDPASLRAAARGMRTIVHLVAINEGAPAAFERVMAAGTGNLVEAARECDLRRIVLMSALGTGPNATVPYFRAKWAAEQAVGSSSIDHVVLRPSFVFGADGGVLPRFVRIARLFPLTPDDFTDRRLPASVAPFRERLFGLTIQPERLREIREERRPGSHYAQLDNCRHEVREAEHLMLQHSVPMLDTTSKSIEEIATTILHRAKLARHIF